MGGLFVCRFCFSFVWLGFFVCFCLVGWFFPLICHFSANSFSPCPASWLYLFFPVTSPANLSCRDGARSGSAAAGAQAHSFSDVSRSCSVCKPGSAALALLRAQLPFHQQMPLLPPEVLCWKLALQETQQSCAQRRTGYLGAEGGEIQNANSCLKIHAPELVCK